jgi:hypothetical protein
MPVIGKVVSFGASIVSGAFGMMGTAAKMLGVAIMNIPIIGWIAAIIAALIALGTYFYKTSATFRGVLMGVWNFIKVAFTGYYKFIWEIMQAIWHVIKGVFNPKNWFDKNYKFSDAFDRVMGAAKQYGSDLAGAFAEGKEKGMESFYRDNPDKRPGAETSTEKTTGVGTEIKKVTPELTPADLSGARMAKDHEGKGLSGSGGGASIKHITQKIDMKNYFTVAAGSSKGEIDGIAEQVVRAINEKLRDGMVAVA